MRKVTDNLISLVFCALFAAGAWAGDTIYWANGSVTEVPKGSKILVVPKDVVLVEVKGTDPYQVKAPVAADPECSDGGLVLGPTKPCPK